MIPLSQLANTNFLLLYFLIFLPPSTLSIIIFFYLASLLTLVSLVLHFLSSHHIFPIALSLFPFNLTSLLLLPSPLASLRVQSLVLFSSVYILRLSLTFSQTPLFRFTRSEEHTSELQSRPHLVCRLLLEKKQSPLWYGEAHLYSLGAGLGGAYCLPKNVLLSIVPSTITPPDKFFTSFVQLETSII